MKWSRPDGMHEAGYTIWKHEKHELVRDICLSCGCYFLRCSTCNEHNRCPDCLESSMRHRIDWSNFVPFVAPLDDSPPLNYHPSNPSRIVTFHVDPAPGPGQRYAIDQDGYLILISRSGRVVPLSSSSHIVYLE